MKRSKNGNLAKLVAFFVIVIIIICSVSFMASGWQLYVTKDQNSGDVADNDPNSDKNDENKDPSDNETGDGDDDSQNGGGADVPAVKPVPEYLHYISGSQITEEQSKIRPLAFVMNTAYPAYGLSSSYLTVEIPTEGGRTRFIAFTDSAESLGKIGSLSETRKYISDVAAAFGGVLVSIGNDDSYEYSTGAVISPELLDLDARSGYYYTEYSEYAYTNGTLVKALLKDSSVSTSIASKPSVPYDFVDFYAERLSPSSQAREISISFASGNSTGFLFDDSTGKYLMSKNSSAVKDLLNDTVCSYDNLFILFADCTTVETADMTESVFYTMAGGKGYYATEGGYMEILWTTDKSGQLVFLNLDGEKLTVNRGSTYVAFAKSSAPSAIIFK